MGFRGDFIVYRGEEPLSRAPMFAGSAKCGEGHERCLTMCWPRDGGWQTAQMHHGLPGDTEGVLLSVVRWTGAPACVATICDSDFGVVMGAAPDGGFWQGWLDLDTAAGELTDMPEDADASFPADPAFQAAVGRKRAEFEATLADDARKAVRWARAAGFGEGVDPADVERIFTGHETFAEDLFFRLLDGLGFPPPTDPGDSEER